MARDITVTFDDGSTALYKGAPDNITPEAVTSRAQQDYGKNVTALDGGRKADTSGFIPALTSSFRGSAGEATEALGELTGIDALARFGKEQREKSAGMYTPTTEADVEAAQGALPTAGKYLSKYLTEPVGEAVGSIAGRYGAPMAIAGAGALGSEFVIPMAIAGAATNAAIHTGENLMRQKEEGLKPDIGTATIYGIGQAAIDQLGGRIVAGPMRSIIGKTAMEEARLLAPDVLSGKLSADAAAKMVSGKLTNVLQATAQNAVVGAGMMTADEALRRASAGQELTSPEALETYKQQAITAAELSPLFGLAHGLGQPSKARAALEGVEKLRPAPVAAEAPPPDQPLLKGPEPTPLLEGPKPTPPSEPPTLPFNPLPGTPAVFPDGTVALTPQDVLARRYAPQAGTPEEPIAGFTTSKGSTYQLTPEGKTVRTKLSPGEGQGQTFDPHSALYVSPDSQQRISDDQGGSKNNAVQLGYISSAEGEATRIKTVTDHADIPDGAKPVVAVINTKKNAVVGAYPASKVPAVGLHPVEKLYKDDGTSNTHIGNEIVDVQRNRAEPLPLRPEPAPTGATTEATPEVTTEVTPEVKPSELEQLQAQDVIDYRKQQDAIDAAAAEEKKSKFQGFKRSLTDQEWADLGVEPKPEEAVIDRTKNPDNIGIGGEPIEKGGKVFASRKEALEAKKNTGLKDYLAIKTPDGYVLTPKLAEDFAREKKAASNLLGVSVDKRGYMDSLESIVSNGGLRPEIASETKYADQNPRIGGKYLFQKNGMTLEQAGEHLREMGYELPETFYENDVLRLIENPTLTPDGYEKLIRAESKQQEEDLRMAEMESDAHLPTFEEFGYEATDLEAAGADRAPAKLQAEARELMLQAEKAGIDLDELTERVFYETRNQDEAAYHSALVREITNALEAGRVTSREPVNRETEKVEPVEQEEFTLKGETPDEVRAKQAAIKAKAAEEARAAKEAEDKAKADAEVGEFTLTDSDRAADVAASRGQKDIFAEERRTKDNDTRVEIPEVKPERAAPPTLDESKVTPAKGRHPQVQAAMMLLEKGKMSREEFNKYVDHYRPIEAVEPDKLHAPTTTEAMKNAVRGDAKLKVNTPIAEGKRVGLRMDLPARDKGAAVVSIHEGKPNDNPKTGQPYKSAGDVISYANAAHITDVEFAPRDQDKSMTMGYLPVKEPLQTAEGKWVNTSTEEIFKRTKELMGKEGWTQVGFDPGRHGYFYDRETGQPVLRAKEVYQVGQFLLAKDVEFGDPSSFKYMQDMVKRKGTPEQIADRNERVSHYGGDVIYQNGDIGVYRTFNLTGDPLYRAFKGDNRLRGNLEDYSGKLFTGKESLTLGKAIEDWKKADAERFKKDPFVKFDKDGVAMSQSIPEDIAGVFKEWKKMLKLDKNIYLTTVEDTRANRLLFTGEQASIGSAGLHDALGMMQRMRNGDYFIAFKPNTSKAKMLETLGHEMGHIHELEVFNKQDAATKSAIKDEYQKWLGEQKGKSAQELVESLRARKTGKTTEIDPGTTAEQLTSYWKSFGEWYADQTAKWATTQEKPLTVVEKFFSKLGAAMKAFYARLRNGKYLPNETFRNYMDRVTESMFDAADRPENMRPMVSDQMEMNFMLDGAKARAQQMLQKRPVMNAKAFEGLDPNTIEEVNKIFYAPNKTIIDRIDSNKGRMWQWIAQKTVSEFRTAKQYSEEGFMKATMSKDIGGMLESLLYYGHATLRDGALDVLSGKDHKGFIDSLKPLGQEVDRLFIWMTLNREANLPAAKRSSRLDAAVSKKDDFIKGDINGKPRAEVYEQARKDLMALNKSVLNVALETGLIDREAYDRFASDAFYVPFYRAMEDGQIESVRSASRLSDQYFSKMLKGNNEKPFGDLMENTLRNWSHILSASMKNDAANTILRDAREAGVVEPALKPGLAWETDANGKNGRVVSATTGKIVGDGELVQMGKNAAGEDTMIAMTEAKTGATDVVKTQLDGVTTYHHVIDPLLLDSIGKITQLGPQGLAVDIMRPFKDLLRFGVTASPMFKASNLIKDSVSAASYSDLGGNLFKNVYQGLYESKKESPLYQSALAGGAVFRYGTVMEGDRADVIKRLIAQGVDDATILDTPEKVKRMFSSVWHKYQELGDLSENANRVALYKQMMEKNYSHLEASFAARDLMNFSAQGSSNAIRFVSATVPFFNARLQGLYKIGRDGILPTSRVFYNTVTGKEMWDGKGTDIQKAKAFTAVTGAAMLASIALYMANKDDKDFKKREQWDRDAFWWAKIPGTDIAIRCPKPFEIGALATLVERSLEQMMDKGADTKRFTDSLSRMVWQTFSMNPVPQLVKPMVDVYANTNPFTGSPIETAGMEKLSKQERKMDSTSPIAVALGGVSHFMSSVTGEAGELSPVQVDYMIRAYMGWLGGTITATSVQAIRPFNNGVYPSTDWTKQMSLGFVESLPSNQSTYMTDFYQNNQLMQQSYADMRHYATLGQTDKVLEILKEKKDDIGMAKFYDATSKQLANIRKQILLISNPSYTAMDSDQKKQEIDRLKLLMSETARQAEEARKSIKAAQ